MLDAMAFMRHLCATLKVARHQKHRALYLVLNFVCRELVVDQMRYMITLYRAYTNIPEGGFQTGSDE